MKKKVCFFSTVPKSKLLCESYSILDIRILEELGYDVIISNNFSNIPLSCDFYFSWWASGSILPLIKSIISNKPLICIAGGNEATFHRDSLSNNAIGYLNYPFYKKLAVRIVLIFSTRLLIVSNFMLDSTKKLGCTNPIVVHNCVDTNLFTPIIGGKNNYILSIFKLDESVVEIKRGDIYIRAIKLVVDSYPQQIFYIIGKFGNAYERLLNLVKNLNLVNNVHFINEIPNSELVSWLQYAKLYVQISDTETFGLSIAEAMSCTTPVLVSKRGAIPEVVGEFGIYVDHNSYFDVARGIVSFLNKNDHEKKYLGFKLRNRVIENFSYESRKKNLQKIIKQII